MDFTSRKVRGETPSTIAALAVALFFGMVLAIVGSVAGLARDDLNKGMAAEMNYDLGQSVVVGALAALFVWSILYFAFVGRTAPKRGVRHFMILLVVSVIAGTAPWALAASLVAMADRQPRVLVMEGARETTTTRLSGRPPSGIRAIVDDYRADAESERAAAESARRDILGAGLVQPYNLAAGTTPEAMRAQLAGVRTATDQAFARQDALLAGLETRITEIGDPGVRRQGMKWAEAEQAFRSERLGALQSRLEASYDETDAMIDLLIRRRGAWRVANGKVIFQDEADLAELTRHATRLEELTWEIDQIEGDFEREVADDAD